MRLSPLVLALLMACGGGGGGVNTPTTPAPSWHYVDPVADATHWRLIKYSENGSSITLALESPDSPRDILGFGVTFLAGSGYTVQTALASGVFPANALLTTANSGAAGACTIGGASVTAQKKIFATVTVAGTGPKVDFRLIRLSVVYKGAGAVQDESPNAGSLGRD